MRVDAPYSGPRTAAAHQQVGEVVRGVAAGGAAVEVAGVRRCDGRRAGQAPRPRRASLRGALRLRADKARSHRQCPGAQQFEQPFTLRKDAMVMLTEAELKQLYDMRVNVAQLQAKLTMALRNADEAKARVTEVRTAIRSMPRAPEAVSREADSINREIDDIIAKLRGAPGGGHGVWWRG